MIDDAQADVEIFWGELSPCEHLVQIYRDDAVFLDSLQGFVAGGIEKGEAVIVIATSPHLNALEQRLISANVDLNAARSSGQYIPMNARLTLERFVFNGHPDEEQFEMVIGSVLEDARAGGRKVRAFGEMVALMWAQGHHAGTLTLEKLWHRLCQKEAFSLFCAYPRAGFTEELGSSARSICDAHSRVIGSRPFAQPPAAV